MRLKHLPIVHQPAKFGGSWRKIFRINTNKLIDRFCCCEVMTHRTNSTKSLHQHRCFPIRMALDESFKPTKLRYVEETIFYLAVFVKMNCYAAVAFNSRNGIYGDFFVHSAFFLTHPFPARCSQPSGSGD